MIWLEALVCTYLATMVRVSYNIRNWCNDRVTHSWCDSDVIAVIRKIVDSGEVTTYRSSEDVCFLSISVAQLLIIVPLLVLLDCVYIASYI